MTNYKMILEYDGTRYRGWQVQGNTQDTIQGKIEAVLNKMCKEKIEIHGSGRTDAGVHAYEQVADFKWKKEKNPQEIAEYLNRYLPEDIRVLSVEVADKRFHSRLNASDKTYRYRIWKGGKPDVFVRRYVEQTEEDLNVGRMKKAAEYLVGTHDFTSFCGNKHFKKSAVRTVYSIQIEETQDEIVIDICGNGFLQNMVRILVGTLVEVGTGAREPSDMQAVLAGKNRILAGHMMPAKGLALMEVRYR